MYKLFAHISLQHISTHDISPFIDISLFMYKLFAHISLQHISKHDISPLTDISSCTYRFTKLKFPFIEISLYNVNEPVDPPSLYSKPL